MNVEPLAVNESQAAIMLGLSIKTLQAWRFQRKGPPYVKLESKSIRYCVDDLKSWIADQKISMN
ncbi:transcriptional regulator, AlpA family [Desulfonatronum thiosulfatophilum]|uniref:Transcriptional regulator, AlpA family n=1 Tax=Desulfonatronum thiosulfatophilum TaxID=617002 RepID=A0A1G6EU54_9BACT|nr:helix-turn-helix domain-containing protein [Desulfonatronum thiosulfatophilum]SDB60987.1 transcriptional regulator, AlpA family [Desulfonatronum thiosulfatophilum]